MVCLAFPCRRHPSLHRRKKRRCNLRRSDTWHEREPSLMAACEQEEAGRPPCPSLRGGCSAAGQWATRASAHAHGTSVVRCMGRSGSGRFCLSLGASAGHCGPGPLAGPTWRGAASRSGAPHAPIKLNQSLPPREGGGLEWQGKCQRPIGPGCHSTWGPRATRSGRLYGADSDPEPEFLKCGSTIPTTRDSIVAQWGDQNGPLISEFVF